MPWTIAATPMSRPFRRPLPTFRPERLAVFDPASPPAGLVAFPLAAQLLDIWRNWAAGRSVPEPSDVDPLSMPALLANLILLDVCDDDFRFRLIGETVNRRYGHRMKGRTLRELMPPGTALDETLYEHKRCTEDLAGVFVVNSVGIASLDDISLYARLLLPVGAAGGRAQRLIGVMEFFKDPLAPPRHRPVTNPS